LPMPFEGFWCSTLSRLTARDLATATSASRQLRAGAAAAAERALAPLFAPRRVKRPSGVSWSAALHRATELSRLLVVGGEDAADMPQLHLSIVTMRGGQGSSSSSRCSHLRLPPLGSGGGDGCSLPSGRYRLGAARLGPLIFLTGGSGPEGDPCPEVLAFDTLSLRWAGPADGVPQARMPTPRYGHEAVGLLGRYLLCIGGKAAGARESPQGSDEVVGGSADVLDVVTGCWAKLPCRLEQPRVYFGATVVTDPATSATSVVVCGGAGLASGAPMAQEGRLASTEILDVAGLPGLFGEEEEEERGGGQRQQEKRRPPPPLQWRQGPPLRMPRYDFSLAGPVAGRLYAVGGSGARRCVEVLEVGELLLPGRVGGEGEALSLPRWELHPVELPEARSGAATVALGPRLLLAAGSQRSVYCFGPAPSEEEDDPCDVANGHSVSDGLGPSGCWVRLEGADVDSLRLGSKVVAFGAGAL